MDKSPSDLNFAAGYFEARGFFKLTLLGGRCGGPRVRIGCSVHNKDAPWWANRWGGTFTAFRKPAPANGNFDGLTAYANYWCIWTVNLDEAEYFLNDMLPYLKRKRATAEQAIRFYKALEMMPVKMTKEELATMRAIMQDVDAAREAMHT